MSTKGIKLFYSYSHKDAKLRDELENHLSVLRRQNILDSWHDRNIGLGNEWRGEIDNHLEEAHIILLLISSDFIASDYCYDVEVKKSLELHRAGKACVIPIILRPVLWQNSPFSHLQAAPKNAKPITTWDNIDLAFTDVSKAIKKRVEELKEKSIECSANQIIRVIKPYTKDLVIELSREENRQLHFAPPDVVFSSNLPTNDNEQEDIDLPTIKFNPKHTKFTSSDPNIDAEGMDELVKYNLIESCWTRNDEPTKYVITELGKKVADILSTDDWINTKKIARHIKYYIYVSTTKVDMIYSQIHGRKEKDLYRRTEIVGAYIEKNEEVGTIDKPADYIKGKLAMRWGPFGDYGSSPLVYFGGSTENTIVGLAGSSKHIIGHDYGQSHPHSYSFYPIILSFLNKKLGLENNKSLDEYADECADTLLDRFGDEEKPVLRCVKLSNKKMKGPKVILEFLAKTLVFEGGIILATPIYVSTVKM